MKKTLSFVALFALTASLAACGKGGSGHALETIENVGNNMDNARTALKSGRQNLSPSTERLNASSSSESSTQSSTQDIADSNGDFEFHFKSSASSQSAPGFVLELAPKSQKMKDALDIQSLKISASGTALNPTSANQPNVGLNLSIGGKSKSSGEFDISLALAASEGSQKVTMTIKVEGETAEVVGEQKVSSSGEVSQSLTLDGEQITEEQVKKLQASIQKIFGSVQAFSEATQGSVSPQQ